MLNAATDVRIGDLTATCGYHDTQAKQLDDAEACTSSAAAAASAGCKCGIPIECPGICPEGEEMLNAATDVRVGDLTATCGYFDMKNQEIIDEEVCKANAEAAANAGCKCGIPIECPGICAEGETIVNRGEQFTICNTDATCGYFESQNQEIIDEEVCAQNAMNARLAGCNCTGEYPEDSGEIECPPSDGVGMFGNVLLSSLLVGVASLSAFVF
jgi:hypothetical protein